MPEQKAVNPTCAFKIGAFPQKVLVQGTFNSVERC